MQQDNRSLRRTIADLQETVRLLKAGFYSSGTTTLTPASGQFLETDISGTYEINWSVACTQRFNVTGNVVLTEVGVPDTATEAALLIAMIRGAGFAVTIPARWTIVAGDYGDGSLEKQFVIHSYGVTGNTTVINDMQPL